MDISRKGIVYSQTMISIPLELKCKARELKINISATCVKAIEDAVKAETDKNASV